MGYYANFFYLLEDVAVDKKKIKELEDYFSSKRPKEHVYGFCDVTFDIENSKLKSINVLDYYEKFYESPFFAKKLSECITSGTVYLKFIGEDGEIWGYKVTTNKVQELIPVWVTEEEYNENLHKMI